MKTILFCPLTNTLSIRTLIYRNACLLLRNVFSGGKRLYSIILLRMPAYTKEYLFIFTCTHRSVSPRPCFHVTSLRSSSFHWRLFLCTCFLLFLLLFTSFVAPWSVLHPAVVFAASNHNPNPKISTPAWLKPLPPKKQPQQGDYRTMLPDAGQPVAQQWRVPMIPVTLHVTDQAQQFVSNDGQLEVDIAAGTISAAQVKKAGGSLLLTITQVIPASGGLRSTHIFFGTYQFRRNCCLTGSPAGVPGCPVALLRILAVPMTRASPTLIATT